MAIDIINVRLESAVVTLDEGAEKPYGLRTTWKGLDLVTGQPVYQWVDMGLHNAAELDQDAWDGIWGDALNTLDAMHPGHGPDVDAPNPVDIT